MRDSCCIVSTLLFVAGCAYELDPTVAHGVQRAGDGTYNGTYTALYLDQADRQCRLENKRVNFMGTIPRQGLAYTTLHMIVFRCD